MRPCPFTNTSARFSFILLFFSLSLSNSLLYVYQLYLYHHIRFTLLCITGEVMMHTPHFSTETSRILFASKQSALSFWYAMNQISSINFPFNNFN